VSVDPSSLCRSAAPQQKLQRHLHNIIFSLPTKRVDVSVRWFRYVWIDEKSYPGKTIFHMLRHCNTTEGTPSTHGQPFGQHAWSLDGGFHWHSHGAEHAYPHWAAFTDAPNQSFDMRERPHLIMVRFPPPSFFLHFDRDFGLSRK
jgi:hypothetical protein